MSLYNEGPTYCIPDPQQARPAAYCDKCRGELYQGDEVFCMDGETMCPDCFKDWLLDLLYVSPDILAHMVGSRRETI